MTLSPIHLGAALAAASGTFYLGCVALMALAGKATLVVFFQGLFHGLDISPILMDRVSFWLTVTGLINTVILSWLFGALIAVIYNISGRIGANRVS